MDYFGFIRQEDYPGFHALPLMKNIGLKVCVCAAYDTRKPNREPIKFPRDGKCHIIEKEGCFPNNVSQRYHNVS